MDSESFIELMYRALDSQLGIVVQTSDVERARAKFYSARRESLNPAFDDLVICPSRTLPDTHLWLVRKSPRPSNGAASNASA